MPLPPGTSKWNPGTYPTSVTIPDEVLQALPLSDRLLVTVLRHRWRTQHRALTALLGSPRAATGDAVHELTPVLEALGRRITPAPITAPTAKDLANLIGKTDLKNASN